MSKFKFIITDHFILQGNQIGLIGEMFPEDITVVAAKNYTMQLFSSDKLVHIFQNIGIEVPVKSNNSVRCVAFRTSDDIKDILETKDSLYILGVKKSDVGAKDI